jgi:hypothetical protein
MSKQQFLSFIKIAIIAFAVLLAVYAFSNRKTEARSTGPEHSYSGAPGESSCAFCHDSFGVNSGAGMFSILGVPDNYTPNQDIPITVSINQSNMTIFGFQLTAVDSAGNFVGTLIPTNATQTTLLNSGGSGVQRTYIQHTLAGTSPSPPGQKTWSFTWRSPASRVGRITFYASGNAGNSNSAPDGDYVYTATARTGVAPFDFDGDSKTDISIFRPSNGQWWIQKSSDNVTNAFTFGTSTDKIVPGDYDGDGKADVAFWRPLSSEWFILRSSNLTFFAAPFGVSTDAPTPGDFDGDGKTDLGVYRSSSGTWFVLKSTGGIQTTPFGISGDIPTVADYDGDGKDDVAIFRPTGGSGGGEWWILRSTAGLFATPFGTATDKPVQGDYTGDGKADVAFFRPSTNEWFVLRSENLTFYAAPFGVAGDTPVVGDYDGDGKYDLGVFRPTNITWFVLKSTGGTLIQTFGATGDKPVPNAFVP